MPSTISSIDSSQPIQPTFISAELPPELVEMMNKLSMIVIVQESCYHEIRLSVKNGRCHMDLFQIHNDELAEKASKKCKIIYRMEDIWCDVSKGFGEIVKVSLSATAYGTMAATLLVAVGETGKNSFGKRDKSELEFETHLYSAVERLSTAHERSAKEKNQDISQILSMLNTVIQSEEKIFQGIIANG